MTIYNTPDDVWQMTVDNRLQGWQVQVSKWDGDNFDTLYDAYAICESLFEACFTALDVSGMPFDDIEWQLAEWDIFQPTDDDE